MIRDIDEPVTTEFGLMLSGKDRESMRYAKGKVITPGTEVKNIATGDVVYYDKRQAFTMIINEDPVTIIQERDIVVVE